MTLQEYVKVNPGACGDARTFCAKFPNMRAAWLSDEAKVAHMLWGLGRDVDNNPGLLLFIEWCLEETQTEAARVDTYWARAAVTDVEESLDFAKVDTIADPTLIWGYADDAADSHANVYDDGLDRAEQAARQRQRDKLRELFPNMFVDQQETM